MTREEFIKKYVQPKTIVRCRSYELAKEFLSKADKFGFRWNSGKSYLERDNWQDYESKTCYNLRKGIYCDYDYYSNYDYEIIEFKGFGDDMEDMRVRCVEECWALEYRFKKGEKYLITKNGLLDDKGYNYTKFLHCEGHTLLERWSVWCDDAVVFEEVKDFTKSNLKNGMIVKLRNGLEGVILENINTLAYGFQDFIISNKKTFLIGQNYNEDLTDIDNDYHDIIEVYEICVNNLSDIFTNERKLIWKGNDDEKYKAEKKNIVQEEIENLKKLNKETAEKILELENKLY